MINKNARCPNCSGLLDSPSFDWLLAANVFEKEIICSCGHCQEEYKIEFSFKISELKEEEKTVYPEQKVIKKDTD